MTLRSGKPFGMVYIRGTLLIQGVPKTQLNAVLEESKNGLWGDSAVDATHIHTTTALCLNSLVLI